jgi:putative membrane protein
MSWGMWLVMILPAVGLGLLAAYVVQQIVARERPGRVPRERGGQAGPVRRPTPTQILDERLARGEIDAEQYQQAKRLISQEH